MLSVTLENWVARPPMASIPMVGKYVRIDPLDLEKGDALHLWSALGGNDGTINDRLKWWGVEDFKSPEDLSTLLRQIEQPDGCCVNVIRLLTSKDNTNENIDDVVVAGMASYIATNAQHGSTEVGYVAHGATMARSPASTEAHYLLAKHAFESNGYRRLEWKCDSNNEPSNRAAIRYGYSFEGCFRQHRVTARGANRDTNWYSIIDLEWPDRKKALESWLQPCNFDQDGNQIQKLESFQK